jgi:hypothetical protein
LPRLAVGAGLIVAAAACTWPLSSAGNTASIQKVTSETLDGWNYDYYRNTAYPCAISGYQTFAIGTKVGSSPTDARPLWVFMHGGGVGYFDENGKPVPGPGQKTEEPITRLVDEGTAGKGLHALIRNDPAGFRTVSVSYCSHDIYAGVNSPDPHNPNTTPDGQPRTTNGLIATKAAIQYAKSLYPTTKTFLYGGSAGSVGTFSVAWSMQLQGVPPAGIVADASLVNIEGRDAAYAQGLCTDDNDPARSAAVAARVHPDLANPDNEIDKLVSSGRFTVPIMHVWNHGDSNTCGSPPMNCPLRDGTVVTMGLTDCLHQPLQAAIAAQGPTSKSRNMPVCVDAKDDPVKDCSMHVTTPRAGTVNTDPASPADYEGAILDWVHDRLADG